MCPIVCMFLLASFACNNKEHDKHDYETESHHEHPGFDITKEQAEKFGIEHSVATPTLFNKIIKTGGTVEPAISDIFTISAKKNGIITLSPRLVAGASIPAGTSLANISSQGVQGGDLNQAANTNLITARAEYERLKPLFEEGLVTASVFREAERTYNEAMALAGTGVSGATITSPADGTVTSIFVNSGDYVEVGTPIASLSKNARLTLRADLPARYASAFQTIETANFKPAGSDKSFAITDLNGEKLDGFAGATDTDKGYLPVYFSFTGSPSSFPPGYAEVYLFSSEQNNVITVPRDALIEMQGNYYIYVVNDGHSYEKRLVKTGDSDGERFEITRGLEAGEEYVSKGASVVRMAEVSAVAPPAHTHNH